MQDDNNNGEAQGSWQKRRRIALALKIALGQIGGDTTNPPVIDDDETEKAFFDMGFEMGYDNGLREIIAVLQGIAAGFDQLLQDMPANVNQMEFDLDGNRIENQGENASPPRGDR